MRGATDEDALKDAALVFHPRAPCGARPCAIRAPLQQCGFNPRAPCGARHRRRQHAPQIPHVSIHAPHAGRDNDTRAHSPSIDVSIHAPHAGRDVVARRIKECQAVSIHAPHAGRDGGGRRACQRLPRFNPRAPCGARRSTMRNLLSSLRFQSTRPMRGATLRYVLQVVIP